MRMLKDILDKYDNLNNKNYHENEIYKELKNLESNHEILEYEKLAFAFSENSDCNWSDIYSPLLIIHNYEYPSLSDIDHEVIEYWKVRSNDVKNPILRTRYLGLIIDFEEKITNISTDFRIKKGFVNSITDVILNGYLASTFALIKKLKIALRYSKKYRVNEVHRKLTKFIVDSDDIDMVIFSLGQFPTKFKLLNFSVEEKELILKKGKSHIKQLYEKYPSELQDTRIKLLIKDLIEYDFIENKQVILDGYINFIKNIIVSTHLKEHHLEHAYNISTKLFSKTERGPILREMRLARIKVVSSMPLIKDQFEIPESFLEISDFDDLYRNIYELIFSHVKIFKSLYDINKDREYGLEKYFPGYQYSSFGTKTAVTTYKMAINTIFKLLNIRLSRHFDIFKKKYNMTESEIWEILKNSWIIDKSQLPLYDIAIKKYFENDFVSFLHISIPQIENSLRELLKNEGHTITKSNNGQTQLITFHDVLEKLQSENILTHDLAKYLIYLFTDQTGLNLRNKLCHGIMKPSEFNQSNADLVFHILISFGEI